MAQYFISLFFLSSVIRLCVAQDSWTGPTAFVTGGDPITNGSMPNMTMSQTITLYSTPINLTLLAYDLPYNQTLRKTILALRGSTNIDSTDRCIEINFALGLGSTLNRTKATGNGGCDGLWGQTCSSVILSHIKNDKKNDALCSVDFSILKSNVGECRGISDQFLPSSTSVSGILAGNGTTNFNNSLNPLGTWFYYEADALPMGQTLFNLTVAVFIVGKPINNGDSDASMACMYFPIDSSTTLTTFTTTTATTSTTGSAIKQYVPMTIPVFLLSILLVLFQN